MRSTRSWRCRSRRPLDGVSGKRELHNNTRKYFDAENSAKFPVCEAFCDAFQDKRVTDKIAGTSAPSSTAPTCASSSRRTPTASGSSRTPTSASSCSRCCSTCRRTRAPALGTDIYDTDKKHVGRSPFEPNAAMVFVPSNITYHGFEARKIEGVRKSVIINYVTNEWRAREQLAFPDQPIAPWRVRPPRLSRICQTVRRGSRPAVPLAQDTRHTRSGGVGSRTLRAAGAVQPYGLSGKAHVRGCTRPRPVFRRRHQTRLDRIEVDVLAHPYQMRIILDRNRAKPALEQGTVATLQVVDRLCELARQPLHCDRQARFRSVQQQVVVVGKKCSNPCTSTRCSKQASRSSQTKIFS